MNVIPEFHSKSRGSRGDRLVEKYIKALGLCSVFVGGPVRQFPAKIGHNSEVVDRSSGAKFVIWEREWCQSVAGAQAVIIETLSRWKRERIGDPRNGWIEASVQDVHRSIFEGAKAIGIALTTNHTLKERSQVFLDRAEEKIFLMQRDGSLRPINKAFRAHRLAAQASGQKQPNYQEFIDAYMADTFELIAREVLGGNA